MPNVCDPQQFPPMRYFEQHELPEYGPPGYWYKHTRGLVIQTECDPFSAEMVDYLLLDGEQIPGIPFVRGDEGTQWESVIHRMFAPPAVQPTSFDFKLWYPSRIIILVNDSFWQFSRKLAPVTMKHRYGAQYFDLRLHFIDVAGVLHSHTLDEWNSLHPGMACRLVSFFTQDPCMDPVLDPLRPLVSHGFSLNMEVDSPGYAPLPITIDPDVENRGGHP